MQLSIITINFNNPKGLERTIKSVYNQIIAPYEYIIVDGASTMGDVEVIKKYSSKITKWVSEPDNGIYSAINKGARMATGDYCLFLNSGDTLHDVDVCKKIYDCSYEEDFLEGCVFQNSTFSKPNEHYTLATFLYSHNPYHQASLIKRSMILENPYDESFKIAGDLDFNIRNLVIKGCSYRAINIVITDYESGGRSVTTNHDDEIRKCYSYFPKNVLVDYEERRWMLRFPAYKILPLIKFLTKLYVKFKR